MLLYVIYLHGNDLLYTPHVPLDLSYKYLIKKTKKNNTKINTVRRNVRMEWKCKLNVWMKIRESMWVMTKYRNEVDLVENA